MRPFRHWTPRYVVDRLALLTFERQNPDAPWLTRDAVHILDGWLRRDDEGLEWGSGRSTTWFGARVRRLVSVEHDAAWHRDVRRRLDEKGLTNVDYRLLGTEAVDGQPPAYVAIAARVEKPSFDFVLVDGVLRDACALAAIDVLKPGGLLILDNANWFLPHDTRSPASLGAHGTPTPAWAQVARRLGAFRCLWTTNGVTDTALFVKPALSQP